MNRPLNLLIAAALFCAGTASFAAQQYIVAQQDRSGPTPAAHAVPRNSEMSCGEAAQAPATDLDDYIGAHFDSLQGAPVAFPAQALNKLKKSVRPAS